MPSAALRAARRRGCSLRVFATAAGGGSGAGGAGGAGRASRNSGPAQWRSQRRLSLPGSPALSPLSLWAGPRRPPQPGTRKPRASAAARNSHSALSPAGATRLTLVVGRGAPGASTATFVGVLSHSCSRIPRKRLLKVPSWGTKWEPINPPPSLPCLLAIKCDHEQTTLHPKASQAFPGDCVVSLKRLLKQSPQMKESGRKPNGTFPGDL
ncbi:PREDICTED: uncharacterized protein LOC105597811 [Cercocebus atys]|uniref:uncharacterized protein LOC105597811 n=1 Tax=Cercocebus atys TaxID=9531 RepID=UPI0005F4FF90|nr:PREDICTED: uncharacterized protein LOC105597811 [Cercocebus atys]